MHSILNNMATRSGAMGVSSFPSSPSYFNRKARTTSTLSLQISSKSARSWRSISCSAVQESSTTSTSTSTVAADTKEVNKVEEKTPVAADAKEVKKDEEKTTAAAKPKPAAKPAAKSLPQLMEEEVIPSLKSILENEKDVTELELSFKDNRLEGSFKRKSIPYSFWAFFPSGVLTGPKGFSLSSYGSAASTVEPFLIDEKKITSKHIVFWVEKRLAAQGILPV